MYHAPDLADMSTRASLAIGGAQRLQCVCVWVWHSLDFKGITATELPGNLPVPL